jgi:dUTP pyrophosphatase
VKIKIKKLSQEAVIPTYSRVGDAGMDITATSVAYGLAIEIPEGYVGMLFPRSSIHKKNQRLSNCVGVLDSNYRGEVKAIFDEIGQIPQPSANLYWKGDRIMQLIILPIPHVEFEEVTELSDSNRGNNGFGSSDKIKT